MVFYKSHRDLLVIDSAPDSQYSLKDFHRAVHRSIEQLQDLQSRFVERLPESESLIFTAHQMILKDERFMNKMEEQILSGVSPPAAIKTIAKQYIDFFLSSPHLHIREKADDIRDLVLRILKNLEFGFNDVSALSHNRIVIACELFPSDVLGLAAEHVQGIILVSGGVTSHVSILARSLQLPLIIADTPEMLHISEGTPVFMDAVLGNIYVQPSEKIVSQFESQTQNQIEIKTLAKTMSPATFTRDGIQIHLFANINLLTDIALAQRLKAEGVGLFRTEFPFIIRTSIPSEEEQHLVYKRLFDEIPGQPVTIRTLDLGGDKLIAYSDTTTENNPELGLKSIRFSLYHQEIFHQQLRAILRASVKVERPRIMFPMISSLDEFREAKQAVFKCMEQLEKDGLPYHQSPLIGAMIEIPSVLEIIDALVSETDFLSIGTNDFIQYLLAVDRTNVKVADYYRPHHPSVLRSLSKIVNTAVNQEKELSICGEMAHDPDYIPFFLGIGVRNLSVYPTFLPLVQKEIRGLKLSGAEAYAQKLLLESTISGVQKALDGFKDCIQGRL
jgi:phosphotransferase system enzyme I (PtsP)